MQKTDLALIIGCWSDEDCLSERSERVPQEPKRLRATLSQPVFGFSSVFFAYFLTRKSRLRDKASLANYWDNVKRWPPVGRKLQRDLGGVKKGETTRGVELERVL